MVYKTETYKKTGLISLLWVIIFHEKIMLNNVEYLLANNGVENKNAITHIENISSIKKRIDDIWQTYFNIYSGYDHSIYWSKDARTRFEIINSVKRKKITAQSRKVKQIKIKLSDYLVKDHVVPLNIHNIKLKELKTEQELKSYLLKNYKICVITKEEDERLKSTFWSKSKSDSLQYHMPKDWDWEKGPWTRYTLAGISSVGIYLNSVNVKEKARLTEYFKKLKSL